MLHSSHPSDQTSCTIHTIRLPGPIRYDYIPLYCLCPGELSCCWLPPANFSAKQPIHRTVRTKPGKGGTKPRIITIKIRTKANETTQKTWNPYCFTATRFEARGLLKNSSLTRVNPNRASQSLPELWGRIIDKNSIAIIDYAWTNHLHSAARRVVDRHPIWWAKRTY